MSLVVVATDGMATEGAERLGKSPGVELVVHKSVDANVLVTTLQHADIAIIRSATQLKRGVLNQLPKLKGILRAGVGIDNIEVPAATEMGIWVWNAPTGNFQATAELALGLLFAAARKIPLATEGARQGKWLKKEIAESGRQLSGSTLGIYGAGNIGLRVARMARGLGMNVLICDPVYRSDEFATVDFGALLAQSDFITLHAPMLDSTRHAFNLDAFQKMKRNAIIVNAARGGLIKDADLLRALEEKLIAGAALDVFEQEPFPADDAIYSKLLRDSRVVATPHIGASTLESQRLVALESADKIAAVALAAMDASALAPRSMNAPQQPRLRLRLAD
ncbi:MAG: hypothetical protein JST16_13655 [Bdellovibrionales bacterium]|nr:hypothetical protein [Bdellovibrionales bacterium]